MFTDSNSNGSVAVEAVAEIDPIERARQEEREKWLDHDCMPEDWEVQRAYDRAIEAAKEMHDHLMVALRTPRNANRFMGDLIERLIEAREAFSEEPEE